MNRDLRAAILGSDDLRREPAEVSWDLGQKVYVTELTAEQRDEYLAETMPDGQNWHWQRQMTARLVAKVLVDESGERLFTDEDAELLGRKPASLLRPLYEQAMRLSGLSREASEQIQEDFGQAQGEPSVSD